MERHKDHFREYAQLKRWMKIILLAQRYKKAVAKITRG